MVFISMMLDSLAVNYKSVNSRYCYPTTDPEVCLGQVRR